MALGRSCQLHAEFFEEYHTVSHHVGKSLPSQTYFISISLQIPPLVKCLRPSWFLPCLYLIRSLLVKFTVWQITPSLIMETSLMCQKASKQAGCLLPLLLLPRLLFEYFFFSFYSRFKAVQQVWYLIQVYLENENHYHLKDIISLMVLYFILMSDFLKISWIEKGERPSIFH